MRESAAPLRGTKGRARSDRFRDDNLSSMILEARLNEAAICRKYPKGELGYLLRLLHRLRTSGRMQ